MTTRENQEPRTTLISGRTMTCPRCDHEEDILRYVPFGIIEQHARLCNPVYKCSHCRWIFSPVTD